jgi:uncharacterized membrane protein YeaQ/YmgE (transglycosylase-associated protein family)
MSILVWALLGLVAGFLASRIVKRRGTGIFLDLTLGVVGALVGGYCLRPSVVPPVTDLNAYSVLAATAGAVVVSFVNHGIRQGFADKLT